MNIGRRHVTLAFDATLDTKDFRAWELDPFTFSTSAHKKVFFLHILRPGHNGTLRLSCTKLRLMLQVQGGVKSTPISPQLRVGVILTDPEPVREEAL